MWMRGLVYKLPLAGGKEQPHRTVRHEPLAKRIVEQSRDIGRGNRTGSPVPLHDEAATRYRTCCKGQADQLAPWALAPNLGDKISEAATKTPEGTESYI